MSKVIVNGVLFVLIVQLSIVSCQIRMRPSQMKLSGISLPEAKITKEYRDEESNHKTTKVPAFVVTKIEDGLSSDLFSGFRPDEPRIPVLMAVKQSDQRRIKNSMLSSESKKQDVKVNHQKLSIGSKLPYSEETLEAIMTRAMHRTPSDQGKKDNKNLPTYKDSRSDSAKKPSEVTTTTAAPSEDPMHHGGAEPVPSISLPLRVRNPEAETTIPVIVGYKRLPADHMQASESYARPIYRASAASTDVYTIEDMLYGGSRPMHSNSIFYQKALSYLKQYRRAILQHRSYPDRMIEDESPKEIVRAYNPITPLIHMQNGPTVPGGYRAASSRGDSGYGSSTNDEQRTEQEQESGSRYQEIPRDAVAVQDGDHNVIGFLPVISLGRGSSGSYSESSYGQSQSTGIKQQSSLRKPLSPSLKLQNLLRSSRKSTRGGESTIPFLTMGFRQNSY